MKNKRGMFFTLLVIALLALFLVTYSSFHLIEERKATNKRVESMNSFIFSLEQDISRQIYISSYRALLSLQYSLTTKEEFLDDSRASIKEALLNGTIEGENISLMEGYRIQDWSSRISEFGNKTNLQIDYSILNISVTQEDPWNIKIDLSLRMLIKDNSNLASWNRTQNISSKIEIIGFEDPLYIIYTRGIFSNKINKTIYSPFVDGTNVQNLTFHSTHSYYIASPDAPSYLDRLEGKTSANPNGVESLVYFPVLSSKGINVEDKSCVDHIYFSSNNPSAHRITGMPVWFKIDDAHLALYNVTALSI